jgi:membrane-associated protease RseP (regulator of RpoE activity)
VPQPDGTLAVLEKPSETEYGVKALPFGGYVKIVGMNPLEEIPPEEEERTFRGKPPRQKLIVLVAGSTTHFITGLLLFFLIFTVVGIPGDPIPVLDQVVAGTPAAAAGLQPGDKIVAVDGEPVTTWDQVSRAIAEHPGNLVTFTVERRGQRIDITARPENRDGRGFLGVVAKSSTIHENPVQAAGHTFEAFWDTAFNGVRGLVSFFAPSNLSKYFKLLAGEKPPATPEDPTGTGNRVVSLVGAVRLGTQVPGVADLLALIGAVNIFVGVVNLLPLFPLDGGWVAVTTYEVVASKIKRRKVQVDFKRLIPVTYAVLALLGFLFITSLYLDVTSPIKLNL